MLSVPEMETKIKMTNTKQKTKNILKTVKIVFKDTSLYTHNMIKQTFLWSSLCRCLLHISLAIADTILWYPLTHVTKPASSNLVRYSLNRSLQSCSDDL